MAAVLACGDGAVLSHLSAAELWEIRRRVSRGWDADDRDSVRPVDVTVPSTAGKSRRPGINLHRSATLLPSQCTQRFGIPTTTPSRTLVDLRALLSPAQFNAAVREAEFLRLPIAEPSGPPRTRTDLEQLFLSRCRHHRLPTPAVNAKVDRFEVDFLWGEPRVIAEVDGWESHRTRSAFEADRARDARLAVLGYTVVRFTWRQITDDPADVVRTIRALLKARGG
jgi:very-short-patch-repair endonuclease